MHFCEVHLEFLVLDVAANQKYFPKLEKQNKSAVSAEEQMVQYVCLFEVLCFY